MKRVLAVIGAALFGLTLLVLPASAAETKEVQKAEFFVIENLAYEHQVLTAGDRGPVLSEEFQPGNPFQMWRLEIRKNHTFAIVNKQTDKCITAIRPGAPLAVTTCNEKNRLQGFVRVPGVEGGIVFESAVFRGLSIDVGAPDDEVILEESTRSPSQSWRLIPDDAERA